MSTDLAIIAEPNHDIASWAERARAIHGVAISLAGTSFVSRQMQGRPDEVTGAILAGTELGLPPMAALRAIDIIDGTPAVRAHALRGIVQSHGHTVWVEESTETRAVVCGHRKGEPGKVQKSVWTIDRAKKANLVGKKNWAGHTQAMLVARATAELCRLIASDAIIGMPYASEELHDGTEDQAGNAAEAPAKKVMRRKVTDAAPVQQVPLPEPEAPPTPDGATPESSEAPLAFVPITLRTRTNLMAALSSAGYGERDNRLEFCSRQVGRRIESGNELTEAEAQQIINTLAEAGHTPAEAGQNETEQQ